MAAKGRAREKVSTRHRQILKERRRTFAVLSAFIVVALCGAIAANYFGLIRSAWAAFSAWFGVSAVLAFVAFSVWRCPKCRRFLGLRLGVARCAGCGLRFR